MNQVGRNLTDAVDGLLNGKRYLIHDRDPLFTAEFLRMLAEAGVASVKLPHQGLDNALICPDRGHVGTEGEVHRRERLGGLLNYYYRQAA